MASKAFDSTFDDEDIFRQFDHYPSREHQQDESRTEKTSITSYVSKAEILDILKVVKSSLDRAWAWDVGCGGRKGRKQKKLEMLEEIERKISLYPDDVNLQAVLERATSAFSTAAVCAPKKNVNRIVERQLQSTLTFLDERMSKEFSEERMDSDRATLGDSLIEDHNELETITARSSHASSSMTSSSIFTSTSYDADTEENGGSSSFEGLSQDDSDIVVTTCNVENEFGCPLGVSITTWSRRKLIRESMGSKSSIEDSLAESGRSEDNDGGGNNNEDEQTLEEVSVTFGDKDQIVVHASRTRSVRFTGIKPSSDDNINRAMELLKNARLMREKMNVSNNES